MQQYPILDCINSPEDLKQLDQAVLPELCSEIREFLIESVSRTGGHLASNLGAVEISVGLHRVFRSPEDAILFDVGHQSYVHKLITGRKKRFDTLRGLDGMSGFLRPDESAFDCFVTGHASNSISAALGMARARTLRHENSYVACVIGDGALTGGMAYEALNDAGQSGEPLVVVFNDNEMSIGRNVGALAARLSNMRSKPQYFRLKSRVKRVFRCLPSGERLVSSFSSFKNRIRAAILKESIFELLGFRYLGPADGNDVGTVCALLAEAKGMKAPVVVHLKTVKGKGYYRSEVNPGSYHGVPAFDVVSGEALQKSGIGFSNIFGANLCSMAESDPSLCAVTAAMEAGTGLTPFAERFPDRFFDVGIAEEHAITMASGMASRGMRPVCAVYSTFLQRGFDQMIHDVAIQRNHVVFAIDRAGLVGDDGATHQGIFDVPYLLTVPGMKIYSPSSHAELQAALRQGIYGEEGPVAIRYPRGAELQYRDNHFETPSAKLMDGSDITLCSYGIMINQVLRAAVLLQQQGISAEVIKLNELSGTGDDRVYDSVQKTGRFILAEDCVENGVGLRLAAGLTIGGLNPYFVRLINFGRRFIPEGKVPQLYERFQVDAKSIAHLAEEGCRFERNEQT